MKQIGSEIGVNESRVSQLHARAIGRLRDALTQTMPVAEVAGALRAAILEFQLKPRMAQATFAPQGSQAKPGLVVNYPSVSVTARSKASTRRGLTSQRQPLSSKNRSVSASVVSSVTKTTRRASAGVVVAIAR